MTTVAFFDAEATHGLSVGAAADRPDAAADAGSRAAVAGPGHQNFRQCQGPGQWARAQYGSARARHGHRRMRPIDPAHAATDGPVHPGSGGAAAEPSAGHAAAAWLDAGTRLWRRWRLL